MKISIITTVNHNIGDDFVRDGIKYLLKQYFKGEKLEFQNIHKHSPITTRYGFEKIRSLKLSKLLDKAIPKSITRDRVLEADILIQSGAPVYWCHADVNVHCYQNEWYKPLIKERFLKKTNAKLVNLAAGTCQKYHSDGSDFCEQCNSYIKEFYELADVTTVRDTLAKIVLGNIGLSVNVIPCSSIFAINEYGLKNQGEDYVVVNYMKGGAHYTFGQKIDSEKWFKEFKKFYLELKKRETVVFSCHNQKEVKEALQIDPEAKIFYKENDHIEYMKFYSKAKFGIMNRVHGAFLLASYGKPSIVIGNDSRSKMAEQIGLKSYFVNDVDSCLLNRDYEYLSTGANSFKERFKEIKEKAYKDYLNALAALCF